MGTQTLIPFFGINRQYENLREEILHASDQVYRSGKVLDGNFTKEFEARIAYRCQRKYAVAVNSCTQGIIMTLQQISNAGKIIVPNISFAATLNSVLMTEHEPAICDTDLNGLIDLESCSYSLSNKDVRAVMYVNLFGHTVDYDRFRMLTDFFGNDKIVIEDAAQSFGAHYKGIPSGKMGDVSVLSFDPTKNLPNYGSGGMVLTDDLAIAEQLLDLRDNGKFGGHSWPGTNSKMSEADCAQMLVKLQYFDQWQARRAQIAEYYIEQLASYVDIVLPNTDCESAWHKFVMRVDSRNALKHHLSTSGVETKIHYDTPLSDLHVAHMASMASDDFSVSTKFTRKTLSLPIYPELTDSEVEHIAQSVKEFYW